MMKVRAKTIGFFGSLRVPGDEFDVPEGTKGSWFEPVEAEAKAEKPTAKAKVGKSGDDGQS